VTLAERELRPRVILTQGALPQRREGINEDRDAGRLSCRNELRSLLRDVGIQYQPADERTLRREHYSPARRREQVLEHPVVVQGGADQEFRGHRGPLLRCRQVCSLHCRFGCHQQ
jgi:hypothetical protein